MKHLFMVGTAYLDIILSVPYFPQEDEKLRATGLTARRGGNSSNSLEVLQQLVRSGSSSSDDDPDLALHLVTALPSRHSADTAQILSSFDYDDDDDGSGGGGTATAAAASRVEEGGEDEEGGGARGRGGRVNLGHCIYREDQTRATSAYIIRSQATGSRTVVNHVGVADLTTTEFVNVADKFRHQDAETWWHFEGRIPETTLQCIQHLRRHLPRSRVSVEIEKPGREGLRALAKEADVVFYSRSWAEGEGYTTAEACLTGEVAPRASLLLCTWGARGACAMPIPGREVLQVEPASSSDATVQIVDAIGAGDTFIAGTLYGLLCRTGDWDVHRVVRFAVDLATTKIQQDGFRGLASKCWLQG